MKAELARLPTDEAKLQWFLEHERKWSGVLDQVKAAIAKAKEQPNRPYYNGEINAIREIP